jgi:hypothetical protein
MVDRTLYNRTGQIALKTITIPQKSDIALLREAMVDMQQLLESREVAKGFASC